jgi:hypothetical protein
MSKLDNTKRLEFLAERYDVFEYDGDEDLKAKADELLNSGCSDVKSINGHENNVIALIGITEITKVDSRNGNEYIITKKKNNKMHTQWMLETFSRLLKDSDTIEDAIRFVEEDLPLAEEYLQIFEDNKKKKKFKELCKNSYVLKGVDDPTNINQYKSLSQLFDSVDPFIERDPSEMEKHMQKFIDAGQAEIVVRDRKFTVFIPKTRDANVLFDKFASWCTCKPNNGMYKNYTEGSSYKKPNGQNSDIYIVIDHRFFEGGLEDNYLYQLHFESRQVRNRKQNGRGNFFEDVINQSEGVANFFHDELTSMAKGVGNVSKNVYIDYLIKFGWTEALFDMQDEFTPILKFKDREVPKMPDISKFSELHTLIIAKGKLHSLHPSVGKLTNLKELLLPDNKLTMLPKEIGNLKELLMLNILGNKIQSIPDEIKYLDKSNGGNLYRIACRREEIGEANYRRLKELLPSVKM